MTRRWKCICAYDGAGFAGWQSQAGGRSIQDAIEACLKRVFGEPIRIHGSGRTDSGVHARAQVFHFDADWRHEPAKLLAAFRVGLPRTIQVKSIRAVAAGFHARFDATGKRYTYHIWQGDADLFMRPYSWSVFRTLDISRMKSAAAVLRGKHDFRALTALNGPERDDTVRNVWRLDVTRHGREMRIIAEADGFLYRMVRSIVGVIVAAGEGKLSVADVSAILASRKRTAAVLTVPAQGLFLERVYYGKGRA